MAGRWAPALATVAASAAFGLAACGGDGGGGPLTKAEFIKRGDAVCSKYRKKNVELSKKAPARNPTDPQATDEDVRKMGPILSELADNVRDARDEFSRLRPPKSAESDWQNTLDDLDEVAGRLDDASDAAHKVRRQRILNDYTEILRLNRRINGFETDYGFKVCGHTG